MYAHITPRIIPPHIHIQERGWDSIGVMDSDWQDKGPDACRARREIYNACNGRIVAFDSVCGREAIVVLSFDGQCMRCNSYFFITYC